MEKINEKEMPGQARHDVQHDEIVLYQPEGEVRLEVRVEKETVWLTQAQIAILFGIKRPAITKHLKNIYASRELERDTTCSILEHMGDDSKRVYETKYYNLDAILSVGYRVNSKNATLFRRWANQVLKDYILKGYAVNQRKIATDLQIADRLHEQRQLIEGQGVKLANVDTRLSAVEQHIDFFVKASQTPTGGILATGTRFDGFVLVADLVKSAKRSVVFIDPFATVDVLKFAAMRSKGISATIYSSRITPEFKGETQKRFDEQESRLSAVEQHIDFFVQSAQSPTGGILATGTRFDGFVLIADLVKTAKHSIIFIDPFATIEVLKFAAMRNKGVKAVIYSARITPEFEAAKNLHNKQYPGLDLKTMRTIHDRFLLIDDTVYHFGASFKDMGNEMTAYSILNFVTPEEVIAKVSESMKGR